MRAAQFDRCGDGCRADQAPAGDARCPTPLAHGAVDGEAQGWPHRASQIEGAWPSATARVVTVRGWGVAGDAAGASGGGGCCMVVRGRWLARDGAAGFRSRQCFRRCAAKVHTAKGGIRVRATLAGPDADGASGPVFGFGARAMWGAASTRCRPEPARRVQSRNRGTFTPYSYLWRVQAQRLDSRTRVAGLVGRLSSGARP